MTATLFGIMSCGSFEHMDSRNPTVSQQDGYDVSWGLAPRKSRGNPKHYYQYRKDAVSAPSGAAPSAPAAAAPVQMPVAAPAAPAPTPISPTIPANSPLR